MWWPLTNVSASAWSGVTVQTPSSNEIKQCLGWMDGPNNCSWFVFAEPTCSNSQKNQESWKMSASNHWYPFRRQAIDRPTWLAFEPIHTHTHTQTHIDTLTSIGSAVSLTERPPSPLWVISTRTGPSRSVDTLWPPFDTPSGFFFRLRGCESAGRRRTWNMMDPDNWQWKKIDIRTLPKCFKFNFNWLFVVWTGLE